MKTLIDLLTQSKKQNLIIAGAMLALLVLLVLLVGLVKQPTIQPQSKTEALVEVSLIPSSLNLAVGQSATLEVKLVPKAGKRVCGTHRY